MTPGHPSTENNIWPPSPQENESSQLRDAERPPSRLNVSLRMAGLTVLASTIAGVAIGLPVGIIYGLVKLLSGTGETGNIPFYVGEVIGYGLMYLAAGGIAGAVLSPLTAIAVGVIAGIRYYPYQAQRLAGMRRALRLILAAPSGVVVLVSIWLANILHLSARSLLVDGPIVLLLIVAVILSGHVIGGWLASQYVKMNAPAIRPS